MQEEKIKREWHEFLEVVFNTNTKYLIESHQFICD